MANGYVNPFIRLPPYHPLYQQQQLQLRRQMQAEAQAQVLAQRRPNDPSVLFSPQQAQPQCLFPSAFPAHGPNIIQRFWIRLFWFFANPLLSIYRYVKSIYDTLQPSILTVSALARQRWQERDLLMQFCVENSWSLLIGLVVIVVLSTLAWFFSPKGENNTYVIVQLPSSAVQLHSPLFLIASVACWAQESMV